MNQNNNIIYVQRSRDPDTPLSQGAGDSKITLEISQDILILPDEITLITRYDVAGLERPPAFPGKGVPLTRGTVGHGLHGHVCTPDCSHPPLISTSRFVLNQSSLIEDWYSIIGAPQQSAFPKDPEEFAMLVLQRIVQLDGAFSIRVGYSAQLREPEHWERFLQFQKNLVEENYAIKDVTVTLTDSAAIMLDHEWEELDGVVFGDLSKQSVGYELFKDETKSAGFHRYLHQELRVLNYITTNPLESFSFRVAMK